MWIINDLQCALSIIAKKDLPCRNGERERGGGGGEDRDKILGLMWVMELKDHLSVYMYSTV